MVQSNKTLASLTSHYFSANSRAKGELYFQDGLAHLAKSTAARVTIEVEGSNLYEVILERVTSGTVGVYCSCPYFHEGFYCKHLWAAIRICDTELSTPLFSSQDVVLVSLNMADSPQSYRKSAEPRWFGGEIRRRGWRNLISDIERKQTFRGSGAPHLSALKERKFFYILDPMPATSGEKELRINLYVSERTKTGSWGKVKPANLGVDDLEKVSDPLDRQILTRVIAARPNSQYEYGTVTWNGFSVAQFFFDDLLPILCSTERLGLLSYSSNHPDDFEPLRWDAKIPWQAQVSATPQDLGAIRITGNLTRGDESLPLSEVQSVFPCGLVIYAGMLSRAVLSPGILAWLEALQTQEITVSQRDIPHFLKTIANHPYPPEIALPATCDWKIQKGDPKPIMTFELRGRSLSGQVEFSYGPSRFGAVMHEGAFVQNTDKLFTCRDRNREVALLLQLEGTELKEARFGPLGTYELSPQLLSATAQKLMAMGWIVEFQKRQVHISGDVRLRISSGTDWFEVSGDVACGKNVLSLPKVLKAIRDNEPFVKLEDGSFALFSAENARNVSKLIELGQPTGDTYRFSSHQALLLDALLAGQSEVQCDKGFREARDKLRKLSNPKPVKEEGGFVGKLRSYQREGLGWLKFLQELSLGGCLADDMGLGKTIQVLALLQSRKGQGPSLVVVPKSLLFNWMDEASRFTPELLVKEYWGPERKQLVGELAKYDLIVTTYAALRSDVLFLAEMKFDYVILDESQTIKNRSSQISKTVRLLNARHRLALSGTPIENNVGELWSLFEFLNPGMLGNSGEFLKMTERDKLDPTTLEALRRFTRPLIFRRTKSQVLKELPSKTEQTLFCVLDGKLQREYEELREYYQRHLTQKIGEIGLKKSAFFILEGLLRLRQFACHPALIDKKRSQEDVPKLTALMEQLEELRAENHKTLIFSQFTSFLSLVRDRLDDAKIPYAYLDGKTKNRKEVVGRFNEDPSVGVFLLSLKAGGLGLNLTAADYVFILDPWWNPAAESQAIDRAHRMGQTRPIMVYRMIVKNTIEEKVLELQNKKRLLISDLISEDRSLLSKLSIDDFKLLFS